MTAPDALLDYGRALLDLDAAAQAHADAKARADEALARLRLLARKEAKS